MPIVTAGFYFATAWLLGLTAMRRLKLQLPLPANLTAGLIIGLILLTQIIFWQSWLLPFTANFILLTTACLTVTCLLFWKRRHQKITVNKNSIRIKTWLTWTAGWLVLFAAIWSLMLKQEADGLYAGWVNIWGDWAAHLTYTSSFAFGDNFPPQMPILIGARFSYPFMADFLSSILIKLGAGLIPAMIFPGVILSVLLALMLTSLGELVSRSLKAGKITALLFLFNGGFGWWWWLKDIRSSGFAAVMANLPREYTHLEKLFNIEWINVITSQVVPQRGFLMGFPAAVLAYFLLWQYWQNRRRQYLLAAALTASLLPLVHAHSAAIVAAVGGILGLIELVQSRKKLAVLKNWLLFALPIIILAGPQLIFFYGGSLTGGSFIKWFPGWLASSRGDPPGWFWLKNLGLMALLPVAGLTLAGKKLKLFSLSFWLVFMAANLWLFQPWEWDNTKFFIHWYLLACILAAQLLIKLPKTAMAALLLISIWAGILDVWRLAQYPYRKIRFWNNEQLELAQWVKTNTPAQARFLTAANHDHWLPTLTGRKILVGFKGWLWTYGLNYSSQDEAARAIFQGLPTAKAKIKEYGLNYAVIGPMELEIKPPINQPWFEQNFDLVYQSPSTKIYRLTP